MGWASRLVQRGARHPLSGRSSRWDWQPAWRRWRWAGLLPLGFNIGYSLATAVGRFSGWRYDLPADWVPYFYFGLGFVELLGVVGALFSSDPPVKIPTWEESPPGDRPLLQQLAAGRAVIRRAGCSSLDRGPLRRPAVHRSVAASLAPRLAQVIRCASCRADRNLSEGPECRLHGRPAPVSVAIFIGVAGFPLPTPRQPLLRGDFPRQGFLTPESQTSPRLSFPRVIPLDFPQAADALVLGCQHEDYVEARLVAFPEADRFFLSSSSLNPVPDGPRLDTSLPASLHGITPISAASLGVTTRTPMPSGSPRSCFSRPAWRP